MMKFKTYAVLGASLMLAACSGDHAAQQNNTDGTGQDSTSIQSNPNGPIPGSQSDFVATAGDRVFFPLNQNQLSSEARMTLDKQAAWLMRYPQTSVMIAGNCDDRGTEEYNIALGQRRANAARQYLEAKGISAGRILTISYGKDRPSVDGDGEDAWAQNRNAITSLR